jgi:hypothetical protein
MKIAVLSRHGRLLALCGLSAALHLLVFHLVARHGARETAPGPQAGEPLVLRLAPVRAARDVVPAAAQAPAAAERSALPRSNPAASPAEAAPASPAARAPAASATGAGGAPSGDTAALRMPARYRVRMPPSVRLLYTLTRRDPAGKDGPPQSAQLDWRNADGRYTLQMDGVLGQVASSGTDGDSGILPQRFSGRSGEQREDIVFDPERHRIVFGGGSEAPDAPGMQDRASLLMQLAGIGLARPGQLQDVLEIVVADAGAARIERFQVIGEEQLATGAGSVQALHLAQLAPAGEARLEVWLAADRGWLPVQLRVTGADGSSATQVLASIGAAAPP